MQNRIWIPLVAAGIALALAVGLLTYVLLQQQTDNRGGAERAAPTIDVPTTVPQAKWRVRTGAEGSKRVTKAERARVDKRGAQVVTVVQTFFDTLFLDPANTDKVVAQTFTRGAAQALDRPGVTLPKGAEDVQTLRRRAKIVLYAETASQAIANVHIRLKGIAEDRPFKLEHKARLWLQRGDNGWRVFAYEINQKP
jgi:hypothetical protein